MDNIELDFDIEFLTDDEVEQMLDSIVISAGEIAEFEDSQTSMINLYKLQQVLYTYKVLKYLTKGMTNIRVTYELHKPYKSMGSVSVIGSCISFRKPEWFMKAVELSNNFEVYPKTDGMVQMNFTFHGLTIPIE